MGTLGKSFCRTHREPGRSAWISTLGRSDQPIFAALSTDFLIYSVFGMTRVPSVNSDHFKHSPAINPNTHAIVIVKDQIFSLNMKDTNGKVKSRDDIEKALWLIIKDVRIGNTERSLPVGVLTGANRDSWTKVSEICRRLLWIAKLSSTDARTPNNAFAK